MVRLVGSFGGVNDPAMINIRCSGTVWPGGVVELSRTGGLGVSQASGVSTSTGIFGVAQEYVQGASDAMVRVIPFSPDQLWSIDCYNTALTSHIGIRHILRTTGTDALGRYVENTATDAATSVGVFRCLAIDLTSGSGKMIGTFQANTASWYPSQTTTSQ